MVAFATYLSFAVTPEIDNHADEIVDGGICALVDESSTKCREWNDRQTQFQRAMESRASDEIERPFKT